MSFADELLAWVHDNHVQRFPTEPALTHAISRHFGGRAKATPYPPKCGCSGTCDIVIPTAADMSGWIEMKYANTYVSQGDFKTYNKNFHKYLFCTSQNEHSVRNDIVLKLNKLIRRPNVDFVGMLVVFLYSDLYPLPENTFDRLDAIVPPHVWQKHSLPPWPNPDHNEVPSWVLAVYWER